MKDAHGLTDFGYFTQVAAAEVFAAFQHLVRGDADHVFHAIRQGQVVFAFHDRQGYGVGLADDVMIHAIQSGQPFGR